jgi:hypothetical protein
MRELRNTGILVAKTSTKPGMSPHVQYAALNKARDKRKRRMERNLKVMLAGGLTQVPVLKP